MYNKSDINFIAIDFETATSKRTSICEVGICVVRNGEIAEKRSWLVRPEDNFYHYWNIKVHGMSTEWSGTTATRSIRTAAWKPISGN